MHHGQPAEQFARGKPVELIDGDRLRALLTEYGLLSEEQIKNPSQSH